MSSTTSSAAAATSSVDSSNSGPSATGAATYYGAIGLAIAILLGASISSRILYTRRLRASHARDRLELVRRGEGQDLPTYRETTAPHTLSYLNSPLAGLRGVNLSSPVPVDHPQYSAPGIDIPSRTYHPGDTTAPPAYIPAPPKYEDDELAGPEGDREAEVGGIGQEVDASLAGGRGSISLSSPSGSTSTLDGNAQFVIEGEDVEEPPQMVEHHTAPPPTGDAHVWGTTGRNDSPV